MRHDNRGYNGGARAGAGRPKTFDAYHQVAVRLPKDMTDWVWRKSMKTGRSAAELLRDLVRAAMEQDAQIGPNVPSTKKGGIINDQN